MEQPHETLPCDLVLSWADNVCTNFGGHHPLKVWGSEECPKFGVTVRRCDGALNKRNLVNLVH